MEMNMHNINIDDKFIAVKKVWFLEEGTVVNITNVDEEGIVSFTFGENNVNNGYMDIVTFREHFEKIEDMIAEVEIPSITEEYIAEIMENSEFEIHTAFDKCTVVSCQLPNGFVITESSACVSSENYDEDTGAEICFDKIADKVWELEAYRLQQWLWEESLTNECDCDCTCNGNCEKCVFDDEDEFNNEEDFDECLGTDLDCDGCDDFDCPYNSNHIL